MNTLPLGTIFIILMVLLLLSAFFSSAETGMMALNRYRLKHLKNEGHRGARRASQLLERPDRLIGLILIGNNLVNFIAASLFTLVAIRLWGEGGVVAAPIIVTLVVLIFAEITPKTIAALHPEGIAFPASTVLLPLLKISYPIVWLVNMFTNSLLKLVGIDPTGHPKKRLSVDELRTIVSEASPHISKRHQGMLLNILDLEKATVEDIMIPRSEVVGINLDSSDEQLLHQLRNCPFTRMPVYQTTIDHIKGLLHQRHINRIIDQNGRIDRSKLLKAMQEPYFVPETTPLHTQLLNFQQQKRRLCLVVDEYGVVQGLATLEDILEEIVGEFTSNLASTLDDIVAQPDGSYIINGSMTIREINKTLHWKLPVNGPKTLNGLLLEYLESFPDGVVGVALNHYHFEVIRITGNLIQTVKVKKIS